MKRAWARVWTVAVLLAGATGASGCSSVPDAVNPVEWYHSVEGWFESDKDQQMRSQAKTAEQALPLPGLDEDYPNLATVPERPRSVLREEQNEMARGLAADRDNARGAGPEGERPAGAGTSSAAPPSLLPSRESLELPSASPPPPPATLAPGQRSSLNGPSPSARAGTVQQRAAAAPQPRTAQPPATSTMPQAKGADERVLPRSYVVYFSGNSTQLDAADQEILRDVAGVHKAHGGSLRVVGHASSNSYETDEFKQKLVNFRLSTARAEAVAAELARLGVPRDHMTVSGMSDAEPAYQGEAGNRRVEIFFGP